VTIEALFAADLAAQEAGCSLVSHGPGAVELAMTVRADQVNGVGTAHGGVIYLLADTAFAMACNGYGRITVARSCSIEYLAAAHVGERLVAQATERMRSGRNSIYDVAVTRPSDGVLIAEFRGHGRELRAP
jgi:acyl-CoA thioesterase